MIPGGDRTVKKIKWDNGVRVKERVLLHRWSGESL